MARASRPSRFIIWPLAALVVGIGGFAVAATRLPVPERAPAPVLAAMYARPVDTAASFDIQRGETLSQVLERAALPGAEMPELFLALREFANPRRIRPRTRVTLFRWASDDTPRAVEVRVNPDTTIRLVHGPVGWRGEVRVTPIRIDTLYVETSVEAGRSLYAALVDGEGLALPAAERRRLVADLAEIYGYKLDFIHDIQPGDTFRFVYERHARPDGTARDGRILVAHVVNRGEEHPAIFFNPRGDGGDYYDESGASLKRAFRRYPVDFVRVTSSFAWRRYHPVLKRYRAHVGTDFGADRGTPVRSTADGTIVFAGRRGGYGRLIEIRHFAGYTTRYAHLSRFAPRARRGMRVSQGEIVGYVGATGLATAPHLHYELRRRDRPLDPRSVRLPSAPPVPEELMPDFERLVGLRSALLDRYATAPRDTDAARPADLD